jgi:DNA (cytosine-5)-methyltransferase 1
MAMTVGSLFSGVGGFDLGFQRAGFDVRWQCEIDRQCRDVLCRRFPDVEVIHTNVCTASRHTLATVDVLCGGFPCTDLSISGRRAGLAGEKSGLFFEFARIIGELRPTIVVIENVTGLLTSDSRRDFAVVLGTLRDLGAVDIAWRVLDAQWFGVAQGRPRVFIVADFRAERAGEILALSEGLQGLPRPRRETTQAAPLISSSGPYSGSVSHALTGQTGGVSGKEAQQTVVAIRTAQTSSNGWGVNEDGVSYTLDGASSQAVAYPLVDVGMRGWSSSVDSPNLIVEEHRVRRLTPRENERLQGFEDDWTRWGASGREMADATRYRMCGNAVCVNVAEWISRRIAEVLR